MNLNMRDLGLAAIKRRNELDLLRLHEVARSYSKEELSFGEIGGPNDITKWKENVLRKIEKEKKALEVMFSNLESSLKQKEPAEILTHFIQNAKGTSELKTGVKILLPIALRSDKLKGFKVEVETLNKHKKVLLTKGNFFISLPTSKNSAFIYGNRTEIKKPYMKTEPLEVRRKKERDKLKLKMYLDNEISKREIQSILKSHNLNLSMKNRIFGFSSFRSKMLAHKILEKMLVETEKEKKYKKELEEYREYVSEQNSIIKELDTLIYLYRKIGVKCISVRLAQVPDETAVSAAQEHFSIYDVNV